jgi:hypothetical protein
MFSRWLKCLLEGWNAFYRVGMISTGLECFRHSWNTSVQSCNDFYRIGKLSRGLEYFRQGWNAF